MSCFARTRSSLLSYSHQHHNASWGLAGSSRAPSNNCHLCDSANDASRYISTGDEDEISEEDEEEEEEFDEEDEVEDAEEDVDQPDAKAADGKSINLYDGVPRLEAFNRHPCVTSQWSTHTDLRRQSTSYEEAQNQGRRGRGASQWRRKGYQRQGQGHQRRGQGYQRRRKSCQRRRGRRARPGE